MAKIPKCYVCRDPKAKEINEAFVGGISQAEIIRTMCPHLKKHSLQHHFKLDHHLKDLSEFTTSTGEGVGTGTVREPSKPIARPTRKRKLGRPPIPEIIDGVKVHWTLPRALVRKLKHRAIDKDVSTVELARQCLKESLDRLK